MTPIATPEYLDLADLLRQAIYDGTLPPGSDMPSLAEISRDHHVSDRTAFEATQVLLDEGLIVTKPGTRSKVTDRPKLFRMTRRWLEPGAGSPWRADMAAQGHVGDWESRSQEAPAPPAIAERLGIEPGGRTMRTDYVFRADGEPVYLSTSWESLAVTLGTPILLPEDGPYAGAGVQDRMAVIGKRPDAAPEVIRPHRLTGPQAQLLHLRPGISCIRIERTYLHQGQPLETADIVLPPHIEVVYETVIG